MTDKEMNKLADLIVDKLLTTYIREQATWYTTSSMDDIYTAFRNTSKKRKTKKQMTEADLLGELAKLMTKLDYHSPYQLIVHYCKHAYTNLPLISTSPFLRLL